MCVECILQWSRIGAGMSTAMGLKWVRIGAGMGSYWCWNGVMMVLEWGRIGAGMGSYWG